MSLLEITDPREDVAVVVVDSWNRLNQDRLEWLNKALEARRYVTATSTNDTEVGQLPWKNKTTIPKLTQLFDTLQSVYMAGLMPTDDWFRWEGFDKESHQKANLIEAYMQTKLRMGRFRTELEKVIRDWVLYGNCFAGVKWVRETTKSLVSGEEIINYVGPKLFQISPLDVVIDPRAKDFDSSPFIWRKRMPIAEFISRYKDVNPEAVSRLNELRDPDNDQVDWYKETAYEIDGFLSFTDYLSSGYIDILEYWGDIYVSSTGEIKKNRKIVIADRSFVVEDIENPAWNGKKPFVHVGWRKVPDNLWAQGPLENLVGMQYRVDHLENSKADVFDQIIHPIVIVKGDGTEEVYEWEPGAQWHVGIDGDVSILRPDTTALNADTQIAVYHNYMDQMAGVPRETAGFRTPGEKSAFEVGVLQQGADRGFQDRLMSFEDNGIERILNLMFEMTIRNLDVADVARVFNDDTRALELTQVTKENVVADGTLRPMGAKHFAARNKRIQEMQNMIALMGNPSMAPHFSGFNAAKAFEEELGFEKFNLVGRDVAVKEQIMTQMTAQQMQQQLQGIVGGGEAPPGMMEGGGGEGEEVIE